MNSKEINQVKKALINLKKEKKKLMKSQMKKMKKMKKDLIVKLGEK